MEPTSVEWAPYKIGDMWSYEVVQQHQTFLSPIAPRAVEYGATDVSLELYGDFQTQDPLQTVDADFAVFPAVTIRIAKQPVCATRLTRRARKPRRKANEEPRDSLSRKLICQSCVPAGKKKFSRPSQLAMHMVPPSMFDSDRRGC